MDYFGHKQRVCLGAFQSLNHILDSFDPDRRHGVHRDRPKSWARSSQPSQAQSKHSRLVYDHPISIWRCGTVYDKTCATVISIDLVCKFLLLCPESVCVTRSPASCSFNHILLMPCFQPVLQVCWKKFLPMELSDLARRVDEVTAFIHPTLPRLWPHRRAQRA